MRSEDPFKPDDIHRGPASWPVVPWLVAGASLCIVLGLFLAVMGGFA